MTKRNKSTQYMLHAPTFISMFAEVLVVSQNPLQIRYLIKSLWRHQFIRAAAIASSCCWRLCVFNAKLSTLKFFMFNLCPLSVPGRLWWVCYSKYLGCVVCIVLWNALEILHWKFGDCFSFQLLINGSSTEDLYGEIKSPAQGEGGKGLEYSHNNKK